MWHLRPRRTRVSTSENEIIRPADCNQRLCVDNGDASKRAGIDYVERLPGLSTVYAVPHPTRGGIKAVDNRPAFVVVIQKSNIRGVGAGIALYLELDDRADPFFSAINAVKHLTIIIS